MVKPSSSLQVVCHEIHRNVCSQCLCLQLHFSLYLYGEFNGTVLLSLEENSATTSRVVWERSGQWEDNWQDITLQLPALLSGYGALMYCLITDLRCQHITLQYMKFRVKVS